MLIPWRVFSNNTSGFCKKKAGFQPNVDHPPAWASWSTSTRPKRGVFWRVAHLGKASNKPPWLTICFQSRNNPGNSRSSRKKPTWVLNFTFCQEALTVGRMPSCDITMDSTRFPQMISRNHARLLTRKMGTPQQEIDSGWSLGRSLFKKGLKIWVPSMLVSFFE